MLYRRPVSLSPVERRMGKPSASAERNDAVRAIVRAIVQTDHAGTQSAAAEALGVTKSGLGQFLSGHSGYGEKLREGLERYLRRPFDEIVAANGDLAALRSKKAATPARSTEVRFGALPGWQSLLEGARAIDPTVPEWCWRELEDVRVWVRVPVTSLMVAEMARFVLRHFSPP
jgi:transcriptional regulator with XRE-family HTH domain